MQINLPAHQEEFINQQLDAGLYASADELFQDMLNNYMLLSDLELKARVGPELKSNAEHILSELGMTTAL